MMMNILCPQVNVRGLLVAFFLSQSVSQSEHIYGTVATFIPVGTVILSTSCSAVGAAVYCLCWLLHRATFVIIAKFNPGQKVFSMLALFLCVCVCVCVCIYIYIYIHTHTVTDWHNVRFCRHTTAYPCKFG